MTHRLLLTGTPVQNNLEELYALLSFIDSSKFRYSKMEEFVDKFDAVDESKSKWYMYQEQFKHK